MTRKIIFILGAMAVTALLHASQAQAGQCRDPWVTQAIQQVTGKAPTGSHESGDCNIYNFNGGRWNSYPELVGYVQKYFGRSAAVPNAAAALKNTNRPSVASGSLYNNPNAIVAVGGGNATNNRSNLIGDGGGT